MNLSSNEVKHNSCFVWFTRLSPFSGLATLLFGLFYHGFAFSWRGQLVPRFLRFCFFNKSKHCCEVADLNNNSAGIVKRTRSTGRRLSSAVCGGIKGIQSSIPHMIKTMQKL